MTRSIPKMILLTYKIDVHPFIGSPYLDVSGQD
jgi:hypothetical protein